MLRHMFVFGVIIPTVITILLFIGFLVCWFKFNMRERLFRKKKLFSKQIKHAMAVHHSALGKGGSHQAPEMIRGAGPAKRDPPGEPGGGAGVAAVPVQAAAKHYENCDADDDDDDHCLVGEDPEVALCAACRQQEEGARGDLHGFSNPSLCASPSHSPAGVDGGDGADVDGGGGDLTETEDHTDTEGDVTSTTHSVTKIGSLIQHTFHFPVSDCPHLSNTLAVDSEDGSEDGNYGHFMPLSHLLRDTKAKQFYAAARADASSPCRDVAETVGGAHITCNENGHLITGNSTCNTS